MIKIEEEKGETTEEAVSKLLSTLISAFEFREIHSFVQIREGRLGAHLPSPVSYAIIMYRRFNVLQIMSPLVYDALSSICLFISLVDHWLIATSAVLKQLHHCPILQLETPLQRLKISSLLPSQTNKLSLRLRPGAFDPEPDINDAVQLIQLATDPRHLARKVDLVAQDVACRLVRP
jgi:hypothetical protein